MRNRFLWGVCILLSLFGLGGCTEQTAEIPEGTLTEIYYERTNPTVYGDDFWICMSAAEVVELHTMPNERYEPYDYVDLTHIAIESETWTTAQQLVLELYPTLERVQESSFKSALEYMVLDGGDTNYLMLTWELDGVQKTYTYNVPPTDEKMSFVSFLKELSDSVISDNVQEAQT